MLHRSAHAAAIAAVAALGLCATAHAQLEEVVVTAQKREQSLQDVSLAVTAVEAEKLRDNQVISLEDLQHIAPSVSFGNALGFAKVFVRGIGLQRSDSSFHFAIRRGACRSASRTARHAIWAQRHRRLAQHRHIQAHARLSGICKSHGG